MTLYQLEAFLDGDMDEMIDALDIGGAHSGSILRGGIRPRDITGGRQ